MTNPAPVISDREVRQLYEDLLLTWNQRDAAGMAALFTQEGSLVGFDGSQVDSRSAIEGHLGPIFADHPTAAFVAKIREMRDLAPDVVLLRAVAGMVPPGSADLKPELNMVHSLAAVRTASGWRAALLQSTPAAWHGRPDDVARLTEELRGVMRRGVTCA
jgi:uncharacterized protein (TIGR02246 family)